MCHRKRIFFFWGRSGRRLGRPKLGAHRGGPLHFFLVNVEKDIRVEKERILVVDDEASVREMVSKIVNLIGHEAVTTGGGKDALEILKNEPFSIMITDIRMPEMDGFELIK